MEKEDQLVDIVVGTIQEILEQILDNFDAFAFQWLENLHSLFLVEQMKYHVISGAEEQCDFLYQLEMHHDWEDPVAIYMESWL